MVKIDLITGFLGAGKTTFLRKYAQHLIKKGKQIGILENDFGAVNVDMMLLKDLEGEQCELEMVAGGCDYDCHKRRFKTKLIAMGMCGYDRVLVEPSGIYDTDEFFDVLQEEPLDRWYEIGNVIMIVDANLERELSETAEYLLASQLAVAGCVLFSHSEALTRQELTELTDRLDKILTKYRCKKTVREIRILSGAWDSFAEEEYEEIRTSGYTNAYYRKLWFEQDEAFTSLYFMNLGVRPEELIQKVETLTKEEGYGKIFRIKGFLKDTKQGWKEVNATKTGISVKEIAEGQDVVIVIGEGINETAIRELFDRK